MKLIVFAHRGEANAFLARLNLKAKNIGPLVVYENSQYIVLISGEGNHNALLSTTLILSSYQNKIREVINYGIAGSLKNDITINQIYKIRTCYSHDGNQPVFKSFELSSTGHDCVSSYKRIVSDEQKNIISPIAPIVDMELWAIASVAKFFNIPCSSYKLISDQADDFTQCDTIKDNAEIYSQKLYDHFINLSDLPEYSKPIYSTPDSLHFTFSQEKSYIKLLNKLKAKMKLTDEEVLDLIGIKEIINLDIQPKERTKLLLTKMEQELNPFMSQLHKKVKFEIQTLEDVGGKINFSQNYENDKIDLHLTINSLKHFELIKNAINELNLLRVYQIIQGKNDL